MADNAAVMWVRSQHKGAFRKARVWNEEARQWEQPRDEIGRPIVERVPAKGYVGNDLTNMRQMREERAVNMVTKQGNDVAIVLSSGASLPMRNDEHRNDRIRKQKFYGSITVGGCPADEGRLGFRRGGVSNAHLLSKEARDGTPCSEDKLGVDDFGQPRPPCPHFLAEVKARREAQAKANLRENAAFGEEGQSKVIAKLVEQNSKLLEQATAPAPKASK